MSALIIAGLCVVWVALVALAAKICGFNQLDIDADKPDARVGMRTWRDGHRDRDVA